MESTRRSFLQWLSVPFFGSLFGCAPRRFRLPADERDTLSAVTELLIPSDDGPGAREANVIEYICRALRSDFHEPIRGMFMDGARSIERLARSEWGLPFVEMDFEDQDRLLEHIQTGGLDDRGRFFHKLLELSLEGFLGDPRHGGNRGEVGWNYIGYTPGTPRPGRCMHGEDCGHK